MPFTLCHPAAALPLWNVSRRRFRLAALVIGSVTPDYEYFLHLNAVGHVGHTLPGLFLLCLPAGWLSLWLFDRSGRRGVETLLPAAWHLPPAPPGPYRILTISAALLVGAASHLVWDAFTHASGWGVRLLPVLTASVSLGPWTVPCFKVLQHGSSLTGLGVLGALVWRWMRRQPTVPRRELLWRALLPGAFLAAAGLANSLRFWSHGFQQILVSGGVAVTLALGTGLVFLGLWKASFRVREPKGEAN